MSNILYVQKASEIPTVGWDPIPEFKNKGKLIDSWGKKILQDYHGYRYEITEKKVHKFTTLERIGRGALGVALSIISIGIALCFQWTRDLFTKQEITHRWAVPFNDTRYVKVDNEFHYVNPKLFFNPISLEDGRTLNFAYITSQGTQTIVPVLENKKNNTKTYCKFEGTVCEALFKYAQLKDHNGSSDPFSIFKDPCCPISIQEFLQYIIEKDVSQTSRLFMLNRKNFLIVLDKMKDGTIAFDFSGTNLDKETLLTLWWKEGDSKVVKKILKLNPNAIQQLQGVTNPLSQAASKQSHQMIRTFLEAESKHALNLSFEDTWIKKIYLNSFTEEEFKKLDQDFQLRLFHFANAFMLFSAVETLRTYGMGQDNPIYEPFMHNFLANNMDIVVARKTIDNYLHDLRKKRVLLTNEEFNALPAGKWYNRPPDIGRIQGEQFINKIIQDKNIEGVKVPKHIVVLKPELTQLQLKIKTTGEIDEYIERFNSPLQFDMYATEVKPISRFLTLQEGIGLMQVFFYTGFNDFVGQNFMIAEDAVYIVDLEYKNFQPSHPLISILRDELVNLVKPEDRDAYSKACDETFATMDQEEVKRKYEEYENALGDPHDLLKGYYGRPFIFDVKELLS